MTERGTFRDHSVAANILLNYICLLIFGLSQLIVLESCEQEFIMWSEKRSLETDLTKKGAFSNQVQSSSLNVALYIPKWEHYSTSAAPGADKYSILYYYYCILLKQALNS